MNTMNPSDFYCSLCHKPAQVSELFTFDGFLIHFFPCTNFPAPLVTDLARYPGMTAPGHGSYLEVIDSHQDKAGQHLHSEEPSQDQGQTQSNTQAIPDGDIRKARQVKKPSNIEKFNDVLTSEYTDNEYQKAVLNNEGKKKRSIENRLRSRRATAMAKAAGTTRYRMQNESALLRTGKTRRQLMNESCLRRTNRTLYENINKSALRRTGLSSAQLDKQNRLKKMNSGMNENQERESGQ